MHCGDVLKLLRNAKKMSQSELAKKIDMSQEMVSHWEKQEHLNGTNLDLLLKGLNSDRTEWELFKKFAPSPKK
jgi:transcriptional regulator with XRE-family HTH domain